MDNKNKLTTIAKIKSFDWRGKKVVLAGGAFDILHQGHIAHLSDARAQGDILVVHITGDRRLQEKKNRKPIFPAKERGKIVAALGCVDHVFIFNGRHYDRNILAAVRPDILYFNKEAYNEDVKKRVSEYRNLDMKIFVSKKPKINSSSHIIQEIKKHSGEQR